MHTRKHNLGLLGLLLLLLMGMASGAGAATFTLTPNAFAISRARTVTAKGTGTAWTAGTTFSVTGGTTPAITGLAVNAAAQTATFTLAPGAASGTLTVADSTDAATAAVTVAASVTIGGSNLTSYTVGPDSMFDPTNEFTADSVGHTIVVSGGSGITAGTYTIASCLVNNNLGAQGIHTTVVIDAALGTTVHPSTGAASGGTWSYLMGRGGNGLSGGNLSAWSEDHTWYMDPDAPLAAALNGGTITISGGTGMVAGVYNVISYLSAYNTQTQGIQNLIQVSQTGGVYPATGLGFGGAWVKSGATILTPTVNSAVVGAVKVVLIGDSITYLQGTTTAAALRTQYPNAVSIAVSNQGVSGSQSADWLIGASSNYLNTAITAANSMGATVACVMIGTNDAKTTPVTTSIHKANIQAIRNSLFAGVATLKSVVLMEHPYIVAGTSGWSADATSDTALQGYYGSYATVTGAVQGITGANSNYAFFQANPQLLQDGVHPTPSGRDEVNYTWLTSMAASIVSASRPSLLFRSRSSGGLRAGSRSPF